MTTYPAYRGAQLGGLKKVLRKIGPAAAAAAAIAVGQPELAVAAASGVSAVTKKKGQPLLLQPPVEPVQAPLFGSLTLADRNALLLGGGAILAVLLLSRGRR